MRITLIPERGVHTPSKQEREREFERERSFLRLRLQANREQLAAELSSTRAREQGLEGELAALRRAVSCAKTEVSLLRAKLATPPSPSVYSQPSRPAPPDPRQSGGEPEMGTGMASWSAPKAEPQMDKKKVELSASDFPPGLKIEPTSRSDILAANKPLSPEVTAAINIEPSKRKLSSTSQALPPARADDFPDTQQDDKPHVKCARFSDPGIPEPNLCPPVVSAPACQRDSSASPLQRNLALPVLADMRVQLRSACWGLLGLRGLAGLAFRRPLPFLGLQQRHANSKAPARRLAFPAVQKDALILQISM